MRMIMIKYPDAFEITRYSINIDTIVSIYLCPYGVDNKLKRIKIHTIDNQEFVICGKSIGGIMDLYDKLVYYCTSTNTNDAIFPDGDNNLFVVEST